MKIEKIVAREILDSRGNPTVEVDVILECGVMDAQQCLPVLLPASTKRWNFAMATSNATVVKVH